MGEIIDCPIKIYKVRAGECLSKKVAQFDKIWQMEITADLLLKQTGVTDQS